ncbi:MAG: YdeI/OmpD-associated family protein [Bacteroidota bacterium]
MEITKTLYVSTRSQWRAWLRKHHKSSREIWLIYYKKGSGKPRISYGDAVEEALCFGWIDSIAKPIDHRKYAQRFTPRKRKSPWSPANKERARRLIRAKKMTSAGLQAFKSAVSGISSSGQFKIPPDILAALKSNALAWQHFRAFSNPYRRVRIGWIDGSRKRPEVFRQRLGYFLRMTEQGKKFGMVR